MLKQTTHDPEKLAFGLDPWVETGFPPAQSPTNRLSLFLVLRRAEAGRKRSCSNKQRMIPKSLPSDLIRGWKPVSRLRKALPTVCPFFLCFGGRRQVGKDHAQ